MVGNFYLRSGGNDEFCLECPGKPLETEIFVLRMVNVPFTIRKTLLELFRNVFTHF